MSRPTKTIDTDASPSETGEYNGPEIGLEQFTPGEVADIERECDAAEAEGVWLTSEEVFAPIDARQRARSKTCD